MDIPYIQKPAATKTGDAQKPERVQPKQAEHRKAENGAASGAADSITLSPKAKADAKLLKHLREKYDELPDVRESKVKEAKKKLENSALKLSPEQIVQKILDGVLFRDV